MCQSSIQENRQASVLSSFCVLSCCSKSLTRCRQERLSANSRSDTPEYSVYATASLQSLRNGRCFRRESCFIKQKIKRTDKREVWAGFNPSTRVFKSTPHVRCSSCRHELFDARTAHHPGLN